LIPCAEDRDLIDADPGADAAGADAGSRRSASLHAIALRMDPNPLISPTQDDLCCGDTLCSHHPGLATVSLCPADMWRLRPIKSVRAPSAPISLLAIISGRTYAIGAHSRRRPGSSPGQRRRRGDKGLGLDP
jgi:hypothetical protein